MKAYLITTGILFTLLALLHLWRAILEWPHLMQDPWFLFITLVAATFSVWAWRLLRRLSTTTPS
jgi:hypothetical protein